MPTLNWIGKDAVVTHHQKVPYRLLEPVPELDGGDADSGNLLVQGDNLHALKALLPRYAGKVKCIYIDPPYNTGQDERDKNNQRTGWIYNDRVDSVEIRKWLHEVVGKEGEDLSRHDKWLCMMYPRLKMLREFLKSDGVIFVSIDDNELSSLRMILDEIYGANNFIGTIIWNNATDNNPTRIATEHEYVVCYAKHKALVDSEWKATSLDAKERLIEVGDSFVREYADGKERQKAYSKWFRENKSEIWPFDRYKYIDEDGIYTGSQSVHNPGKEGYRYDVIHPETGMPCKQPMMGYRFPEATMKRLIEDGRVLFGDDETKLVELKVYVKDYRAKLSSLFELDGRVGTNEIKDVFPEHGRPFDFPKPTGLVETLLSFTTSGNDIVLDSFAGSGTTAQAVMQLNNSDSQDRKFILVEMKDSIAEEITAERVRRVLEGYSNKKGNAIEGLGGGFRYYRLSDESMFDAFGQVRDDVTFEQLAEFVWFKETGTGLPPGGAGEKRFTSPLLGIHEGQAIYLLFNGILGDKSINGGNVLTGPVLDSLPAHDGPKTFYAAACRLGASRLRREQIVFKQTPYALDQ